MSQYLSCEEIEKQHSHRTRLVLEVLHRNREFMALIEELREEAKSTNEEGLTEIFGIPFPTDDARTSDVLARICEYFPEPSGASIMCRPGERPRLEGITAHLDPQLLRSIVGEAVPGIDHLISAIPENEREKALSKYLDIFDNHTCYIDYRPSVVSDRYYMALSLYKNESVPVSISIIANFLSEERDNIPKIKAAGYELYEHEEQLSARTRHHKLETIQDYMRVYDAILDLRNRNGEDPGPSELLDFFDNESEGLRSHFFDRGWMKRAKREAIRLVEGKGYLEFLR